MAPNFVQEFGLSYRSFVFSLPDVALKQTKTSSELPKYVRKVSSLLANVVSLITERGLILSCSLCNGDFHYKFGPV